MLAMPNIDFDQIWSSNEATENTFIFQNLMCNILDKMKYKSWGGNT